MKPHCTGVATVRKVTSRDLNRELPKDGETITVIKGVMPLESGETEKKGTCCFFGSVLCPPRAEV